MFSYVTLLLNAKKIGKAFVQNWKIGIILILLGVMYYQNNMKTEVLKWVGLRTIPGMQQDIDTANHEIDLIQQQLTECERGRTNLKAQVKDTNGQINKWYKVSEELRKTQQSLNNEISELKTKTKATVIEVLEGNTPQTCASSIQLLRDAASE